MRKSLDHDKKMIIIPLPFPVTQSLSWRMFSFLIFPFEIFTYKTLGSKMLRSPCEIVTVGNSRRVDWSLNGLSKNKEQKKIKNNIYPGDELLEISKNISSKY